MGKKKKQKINAQDIFNSIDEKYLESEDVEIVQVDKFIPKLDMMVNANLGYKLSNNEYISVSSNYIYRLLSKFMYSYNKQLKEYRRSVIKWEFGEKDTVNSKTNLEMLELTKYLLDAGTYFAYYDKNTYMCLILEHSPESSYIKSTFYIVGKNYKKAVKKLKKEMAKYKEISEKNNNQRISFFSTGRNIDTIFKSFDDLICDKKDDIIEYVDNWYNSIPTYYNKYNMIPKLSILLYGKPGTGKSTFYKALAKHFDINTIKVLDQSYFYSIRSEYDSGRYRDYGQRESIIYAIDDIDCVCENRDSKKNNSNNSSTLSNLLAFLDNPPTFDIKANDGIIYPVSIVVATTNYFDRLDEAVRRYGRFDLLVEMENFDKNLAQEMCDLYDLKLEDVVKGSNKKGWEISPSKMQAICLKNIDNKLKNKMNLEPIEKENGRILIHRRQK